MLQDNNIFIYGLAEPDTLRIKYIGQTNNPKKRYWEHINYSSYNNDDRSKWIKSLKKKRLSPVLAILMCVPPKYANSIEEYFIRKYRGITKLTNKKATSPYNRIGNIVDVEMAREYIESQIIIETKYYYFNINEETILTPVLTESKTTARKFISVKDVVKKLNGIVHKTQVIKDISSSQHGITATKVGNSYAIEDAVAKKYVATRKKLHTKKQKSRITK